MANNDIITVDTTNEYKSLDEILAALGADPETFQEAEADEIDEDWPYTDEDYSSNAPCDFSGFCAGSSCPNFFKCKGFTK